MILLLVLVGIWLFAAPSLHIDNLTLNFIEGNTDELAKLVEESDCDRQEIGRGIQEMAVKDGLTASDQYDLAVGPGSLRGARNCLLAIGVGLDEVYFFSPKRNCWIFDRSRLSLLRQCPREYLVE